MNSEKIGRGELAFLVCLILATVASFVAAVMTWQSRKSPELSVPNTVTEVLDTFVLSDSDVGMDGLDDDEWFRAHFEDTSDDSIESINFYFVQSMREFVDGVTSYEVEPVTENFIVIRAYDDTGNLVPPPMGLWYKLSKDGRISEWHVGRLQPFSRYDADWSEVFDSVY